MTITQSGYHLNVPPIVNHLNAPFGVQHISYVPSIGIVGGADLVDELAAKGATVTVADAAPESLATAVEELNRSEVALIHLELDAVDIMAGLRVPSIVVADAVVKAATPQQRSAFVNALKLAGEIVVTSEEARQLLIADDREVGVVPPGAGVAAAYIRLAQKLVAGQPSFG